MSRKWGLVNYEDVEFAPPGKSNNNGNKGKDSWMRFNQGENEVRLLTDPFQYTMHRYKHPGDKGIGERVLCSLDNGSCPLCDMRDQETGKQLNPPKERWYAYVIDRRTGKECILDMAPSIFRQLKKLNKNPKVGDPKNLEINIEVDKNGPPTDYYDVQNLGPAPLSEDDVKIKKGLDLDRLIRRCKPPTTEEVVERMKRIDAKFSGKQDTAQSHTAQAEEATVAKAEAEATVAETAAAPSGDDEYAFPPAQVS
jgi:hypothetical protein